MFWWKVADIGLNVLHTFVLFFVCFGWTSKKIRKYHLIVLGLVLLSWIGLGYWYGFGYCVLTDVHWKIKNTLGETDLPSSFIAYFSDKVFHVKLSDDVVGWLAYGLLGLSVLMSVFLNIRDRKCKKPQLCCPH